MRPENTAVWRKGLRRKGHRTRAYGYRQLARDDRLATVEALRIWRGGNRVNAGTIPAAHG